MSAAPQRRELADPTLAAVHDIPDDAELTRRLVSLISLLGIYAVGLVLVAFVSDGPDIGVLLAALFGHATWVGGRYLVRERRERRTTLAAGERGLLVFARRARFIRYRDIANASSTAHGLTLRLRGGHAGEVVLRWADDHAKRVALLHRIDRRLRRAAAITSAPARVLAPRPRASVTRGAAAAARESIARISAAFDATSITLPAAS